MTYIIITLYGLLLITLCNDFLNILQQNHYKIPLMKYYLTKYYQKYSLWLGSFIFFNVFHTLNKVNPVVIELFSICLLMYYLINKRKKIIKLKMTKRIIRISTIYILSYLVIFLLLKSKPFILINSILIFFPLINIIGFCLTLPIEKMVNQKYINQAKKIINENKSMIKIAITGSYGKTSTKNIIYQLLKDKYLTVVSPKSFNTLLGITKTINEIVDSTTQILIIECGATREGDIEKIANLVKPDIAIITNIGPQHLESFKTMENITKTKFELIDALKYDDCAIINIDNEYIKNRQINNVEEVITISLEDDKANYYAKVNSINPLKFTIYKKGKKEIDLTTNLIGRHNVQNILFSYAVLEVLKNKNIYIKKKEIEEIIKHLKPSNNRLEYKRIKNIHLYDDSYNSNIVGFKNACEVMSLLPYKKIIITPGIVELGSEEKNINLEIAETIKKTFDEIYIINHKGSHSLIKNLKNSNLIIASGFKEAYNDCINKYQDTNEEVAILIENDLPDSYLER